MLYKYRFLITGFMILTLVFSFGLMFMSISGKTEEISYNTPKKDLNGVFCVYNNKIFAMVPSNGYYEVKGADPAKFKVLTDNFNDAHIGYDDQYVYAGNMIIKGLNPKTLKVLGNNYYTDGKTTYYCARNSEKNENLGALGFVVRLIGYNLDLSDKPQNYWYPFVELPKSDGYASKNGNDIGGNTSQAFYEGQEMPEANPSAIRPLRERYVDRGDRESSSYFTDGKNVYYKNQLLPVAYNNSLFEIGIDGDIPSRSAYLIDDVRGMVFADGHSFDASAAPYKMLSANLKHANQALFSSRKGIYFYDSESETVKKAGDNPFVDNQFKPLAPDVFASGDKVYFLQASEHWGRKTGLGSRSTHLLALEDVSASSLKKLDNGENPYQNIWQAGKRYFYFDHLGSSNLMSSAVYEIKDETTAKSMLNRLDLRHDDIRKLSSSGALFIPSSDKRLTSSVSYDSDWYRPYLLILGGAAIALLVSFLLRNKKMAPFVLKDGYLMFNNISFKRYAVKEIDKVVFSVVRSNYRSNSGYTGRMQIVMKNGKKTWQRHFSTRITILSESEATVRAYVDELCDVLAKENIKTEVMR